MTLQKVIVGVTGSIAAYKALYLVRLFVKKGCEVKVVMTPTAAQFVSALSFATLSKNSVNVDLIEHQSWNNHVDLGLWADAMIIAPTTATTLAKLCHGQSDNMLVATYLSATCPIFVAPAMDLDMWKHPATQQNIQLLKAYGNHILPVGHGELASGLIGDGRMEEPENILAHVMDFFSRKNDLNGKNIMITAGPTNEDIDPVRFIGNRSTGLMGISLAEECAFRGAHVHLILGPTHLNTHVKGVKTVSVITAQQMYDASKTHFPDSDVAIFAAAVADYKPKVFSNQKLKKGEGDMHITLDRTKDIAGELGAIKLDNQVTVGFALETQDEIENAQQKLKKKNFDFIVLNSLQDKGAGFSYKTNKISIIQRNNKITRFKLKSKKEVAMDVIDEIVEVLDAKK